MTATDDDTLVGTGGTTPRRAPPTIRPGAEVGRYVVIERVGAGGMGVVYSAWDPELDRRVAIKLLRPDENAGSGASSVAGDRLLREARAMAALQHPNVVAVHDVGAHEGCVFIAMEFVQGLTLGQWRKAAARTTPEIITAYVQAGRGLEAAHAHGLVHRDFKPDNAMVSDDGRVRTLDFGLVRATASPNDGPSAGASVADANRRAALSVESRPELAVASPGGGEAAPSATAGPIGTPRYMSPEQHRGDVVDARSDQFSFCVALYEALYESPPFTGSTVASVAASTLDGVVEPAPEGSAVPSWVRTILLQGLERSPEDRHPTMAALLAGLRKDPSARRNRLLVSGGAVVLVAGLAVATVAGRDPKPCRGFETALDGVWDDARKAEVEAAMLATDKAYAQDAWSGVQTRLDAWARSWAQGRRDACEAANVRGDQSAALMDRRVLCYDESLRNVRAVIDVLSSADAAAVERSIRSVEGVEDLGRCADADGLLADVAPPRDEATKARVAQLRDELASLEARETMGAAPVDLMVETQDLLERARTVDYPPLVVEALVALARLSAHAGEREAGAKTYVEAYELALEIQWLRRAASVARLLQLTYGDSLRDSERADVYGLHARAFCSALGEAECVGANHNVNGQIERARGEHQLALDHHQRALEIVTELSGSQSAAYHKVRSNIANDLRALGRYTEARAIHLEILEANEKRLGPDHPDLVNHLLNLGAVTASLGAAADAVGFYDRALVVGERSLGPEHPALGTVLNNKGNALARLGRDDEAEAALLRALSIRRAKLPKGHPWIAATLHNLAEVMTKRGALDKALAHHREALEIAEASMGAGHPKVGMVRVSLAVVLAKLGRDQEGLVELDRGLTVMESALGATSPELINPLQRKLTLLRRLGRTLDAIAVGDRALVIAAEAEVPPHHRVALIGAVAELLWAAKPDAGRDVARAQSLVDDAIEQFESDTREEVVASVAELRALKTRMRDGSP